jgi:acyl carrier protein
MPEQETVEETLKRIVLKITRKQNTNFSSSTKLEDLGADSLDRVQILMALEETYDIEIQDEEISDIEDMSGFIALIKKKIADKELKNQQKA